MKSVNQVRDSSLGQRPFLSRQHYVKLFEEFTTYVKFRPKVCRPDTVMSNSNVIPWMQSAWLEPLDSGDSLLLQRNPFVSTQTQGIWPQGVQTIGVLHTDTPAYLASLPGVNTNSQQTTPLSKQGFDLLVKMNNLHKVGRLQTKVHTKGTHFVLQTVCTVCWYHQHKQL